LLIGPLLILVRPLLILTLALLVLILPLLLVLLPGCLALVLGKARPRRRRRTALGAALAAPPGNRETEGKDHSGDRHGTHSFRV
jgi:hypothetical protein